MQAIKFDSILLRNPMKAIESGVSKESFSRKKVCNELVADSANKSLL